MFSSRQSQGTCPPYSAGRSSATFPPLWWEQGMALLSSASVRLSLLWWKHKAKSSQAKDGHCCKRISDMMGGELGGIVEGKKFETFWRTEEGPRRGESNWSKARLSSNAVIKFDYHLNAVNTQHSHSRAESDANLYSISLFFFYLISNVVTFFCYSQQDLAS